MDKIRNEQMKESEVFSTEQRKEHKLKWLKHLLRMSPGRMPKQA
jgi:hypothetical protein